MLSKKEVIKFLQGIVGQKWVIGLSLTPIQSILAGEDPQYKWIKNPYSDRWFADPFLLDYNEDYLYILCEEYCYKTEKGRIALLTIDRSSVSIVNMNIILELETHLSFPFVIKEDNNVYILPENGKSGFFKSYIYNKTNKELIINGVILHEPLADAVLLNWSGKDWLFATKAPNENGPWMYIYEKENGAYKEKFCLKSGMSSSRMAGSFFESDGKLYRPVQDCDNNCYGHKVILQESRYVGGEWIFKDVISLSTKNPSIEQGFHTFNVYKDIIIVDKRVFRHPWIAMVFEPIKGLFLKIFG